MTNVDEKPGIDGWQLPLRGPAFERLDPALAEAMAPVSSATACAQLHQARHHPHVRAGGRSRWPAGSGRSDRR
jgi:hypothetical protein